jgi:hypothetical protein
MDTLGLQCTHDFYLFEFVPNTGSALPLCFSAGVLISSSVHPLIFVVVINLDRL